MAILQTIVTLSDLLPVITDYLLHKIVTIRERLTLLMIAIASVDRNLG